MTAFELKIGRQVKQHWSYIHKVFVYSDGTPMTQVQAIARLWAEFNAKTRNLTNPVILTAELEILDPMPYEATVYRKDKGRWHQLQAEGMTPLTVHIVGEVEYDYDALDGKKEKRTVKVFHRFIGKTFPQYA